MSMDKKTKQRIMKFLDRNITFYLIIFLLVGASIFGVISIKKFIGYAGTAVESQAGTITELRMDARSQTIYWAGLFGLVFSQSGFNDTQSAIVIGGSMTSNTFVFDCMDPSKAITEMYASLNSTIDFSSIIAGSTGMIDDDFLNLSASNAVRANNTFIYNESVLLGSTNISGIPAAYTYVNDAPNNTRFFTGILNSSGNLVFVIKVFGTSQTNFKGSLSDYQAILPVPNSTKTYYFFPDPYDTCPAGFGTGAIGDAIVTGYVIDSNTSLPISDATVSAGGNTSYTDAAGFFNFTVPGDRQHVIVSLKDGYEANISTINTTIGVTTNINLSMAPFFGRLGPNGTVFGYVVDNSTGLIISNATIYMGGKHTYSNATGNYSFTLPRSTYVLASIKEGFQPFVTNLTIYPLENMTFIINMTPINYFTSNFSQQNGTLLNNGTIQGFVTDNSSGLPIVNVTVTVAGVSNLTNASGFYNITALQGTSFLVAVRSGYNNFVHEVNITSNLTILNFSMEPLAVAQNISNVSTFNGTIVSNGSVIGVVRSSSGLLSSARVSVAGISNISNSTGDYVLLRIPPGTHNLVATRSGYTNYFAEINVTEGQATYYNFTMETTVEAGLGAGSGAGQGAGQGAGKGSGQGAGQGAGRGPGTGIPAQLQQPNKIVDYEISVKQIIKKLKVGNFIGVPITITNFKEDSVNIKFAIEGDAKQMTRVDKDRMIIDGGSSGDVMITLLGNVEPGIYEGAFVISGDINEKIPIYVLVLEKDLLSVESLLIKLTPLKKSFTPGELFRYTVDLQNLLSEEKYKVVLSYYIDGITANASYFLEKEEVVIHTSFSLLKSFKLPDDIPVGDYALRAKAEFLELESHSSTIFAVGLPFYKYKVFGVLPAWIIGLVLLTASSGTFGFIYVKKKRDEKKRYKIELDLNQLPKPGPRSAYVGQVAETKTRTYFDLDLFQVHTILAGSSGSGKSVVAQDLVEEALLHNVAVIVFDPTAQWTGFLRRLEDKKLLGLYKNFGMRKTDSRAFNGNVHMVEEPRELLDFHKVFKPGEINVFVISKLDTKGIELFVSNAIKGAFHANLPESKDLKYLMIYDGIHSLLPKFGGSGQVFVQIERATREFRKWGIGLILLSQVLNDFPPEVLANINTEIQLRSRDENDLNRIKEKYGESILQSVVKAALGTGVVQNSAYNKGKPYFIQFRPPMHSLQRISDEELENYNKYNLIIEDLEYQLEQLEKENLDVFDLKLELKLSQDKVKSGNFNMVAIYLEGLLPRINAQWDKIGKTPRKKQIKFFEEGGLEQELEKAKKEIKRQKSGEGEEGDSTEPKEEIEVTISNQSQQVLVDDDTENLVDNCINRMQSLVAIDKKQEAVQLYGKIQDIYKAASKETKAKIIKKCIRAQQILSVN